MPNRKLFITALLVLTLAAGAAAQAAWSPEMQTRVKALGSPRVSPDGKRIVYTVANEVMTAERSEYVTQIWLANTDGTANNQITFADKTSTNPKWSPDGNWIAFTSTRKDNKSNIYVIRTAGGEAEQITDVKGTVSDFEWSPDGKSLALQMTDPKTDDEEKNDKARNDFRWVDENLKMSRLYVMPFVKDASGKRELRKLTTENRNVTGFAWSPDSKTIVYNHVSTPSANDWPTSDIAMVDVLSGSVRTLANRKDSAESALQYSPDGKWISGIASDSAKWAQHYTINIYPATGGPAQAVGTSFDAQPSIFGWSADSSKIYLFEGRGTSTCLYSADIMTRKFDKLMDGAFTTGFTMNASHTWFGYVAQSAARAAEVVAAPVTLDRHQTISHVNDEFNNMPIGKTVVITWKNPKDGRTIEGLLTYPVGYVEGQKVPFLLNIHGGPAGVFTQSFIGNRGVYPIATFAQRGYAILRPNPRGSSGYGTEFRRANIKDWGGMDYDDIMSGVDKVIEMGVADPNRMGVMGWSYGGYMTTTIVTKTTRFKAASAGAPVTNLMSFNGTADIPAFVPDYFGGQSWEIPEVYAKHSAMFNIKGVTTPTLIEQGDADVRVPISQGFEFYNALKQQGVPTRMLVLPRQPHGPTEPKMQIAAMQANLDWFEKYLR